MTVEEMKAADVLSSLQRMQNFGVNLICVEDGIDSSKDAGKFAFGRRKNEKIPGTRNEYHIVKLPAFFMYYNPRLAPTENIITMDYPVFGLNMELCGIDMIEQYLNAIIEEQKYLLKYEESFVVEKLRQFHPNYEKEFFNVREILELKNRRP